MHSCKTLAIITCFQLLHFISAAQATDQRTIAKKLDSSVVTIRLYDNLDKEVKIASGVIVHSEGIILTNDHIFGTLWVKGEVWNELLGRPYVIIKSSIQRDETNDIAFFKIDAQNLRPITFGNSNAMAKGDLIYCMGSPDGMNNLFTDGMIAGFHKVSGDDKQLKSFIQFTAKTFEGSSGGALVDYQGRLIGITTGAISRRDIGFAIPVQRLFYYFKEIGITMSAGNEQVESMPLSYKPSRIISEEELERGTGYLSVWSTCSNCKIDVYIDDQLIGQIDKPVIRQPLCGEEGALKKKVSIGKHLVRAEDKEHRLRWQFEKIVNENDCTQVKLTLN